VRMKVLLLLLGLCSISLCDNHACEETFRDHCIEGDFPRSIAHGIHSLTLEDLRYYFDLAAKEDNMIPSVNFDLTSPDKLFESAPLLALNNTFRTPAMNSVDHILSNWENENFMMVHGEVLEKLVHNLHMYETLSVSGKIYKKLKKRLNMLKKPHNQDMKDDMEDICSCVNDEEHHIEDLLTMMADSMREAEEHEHSGSGDGEHEHEHEHRIVLGDCSWRRIEYGNYADCCGLYSNNGYCKYYAQYIQDTLAPAPMIERKAGGRNTKLCKLRNKLPSNPPGSNRHLIVDPNHVHGDGSSAYVQPLVSSDSWKDWKDHLHVDNEDQWNYNLAVYIYCKLSS